METFAKAIKKHYFALILALILGILMVLPFFYFQTKLGPNFKGIFPEVVNDEYFYYARIKDAALGHPFLSNAYLAEHKEGVPQQVFLAEWLLAQPIKFLNININTAHLAYNFLLPIVAFILTYLALYLISKSRFWAIIFSTFLFFGLYLSAFIRPVSPQFNFIFWLTQFIFLWLLINNANDKKKLRMLLIANIVNFGFLFYIYPYYWTFYLIFLGLLTVSYFWKERTLSYKILMIAGGGLILAIPYFYFNYLASQLPYYIETLTRLGMIYTRFPSGIRTVFWSTVGLIVLGVFIYKKIVRLEAKTIFFGAGFLASVIAVNQHLITGKNFEFSSHYDMGATFFLVFAAAYLWSFTAARKTFVFPMIVIIALAAVFSGLYGYSNRLFAISEGGIYIQNYAPIFEWLNKNTEKDSVVYANAELSGLVPVYTANNVFYVRESNLFFISDGEVLDRFILNNYFKKFDENFVTENVRSIYGTRYINDYGHAVQGNKLRRLLGLKLEPEIYLPEEAIETVAARAKEIQKDSFENALKRFKADYLIWDKNKNPDWRIDGRLFDEVYSFDNLVIYRVK